MATITTPAAGPLDLSALPDGRIRIACDTPDKRIAIIMDETAARAAWIALGKLLGEDLLDR